ncbi:MAG: S1 family peptidase [Silvanigrellaceae bacterium]
MNGKVLLSRSSVIFFLFFVALRTHVLASGISDEELSPAPMGDSRIHPLRLLGSGRLVHLFDDSLEFLFSGVRDYQIGDEWGKQQVDVSALPGRDQVYRRSVNATAFFNTATSFYLGKFAGEHVMATNHHVLDSAQLCPGRLVQFSTRKQRYRCKAMIGTWPEIDLALFVLDNADLADVDLLPFAGNFSIGKPLEENTLLLTAGFGIAGNTSRMMTVNENSDCRVVSRRDEFRLMADPDRFNPAEYKAWSFATGCSVSHGDSGSPVVNRQTGEVVGIVWTGAIPKEERIQKSSYLREIQSKRDEEIWSLLTYVVPSQKIGEKLRRELIAGSIPQQFSQVVREILNPRP